MASIDGGGVNGQAEALTLAISRALCKINPEHRPALKAKGLMRRDPEWLNVKNPDKRKHVKNSNSANVKIIEEISKHGKNQLN